jgi:hypothetical protein
MQTSDEHCLLSTVVEVNKMSERGHTFYSGSCMGICLWFVSSKQQTSAPLAICSQLQLVSNVFHHGAIYLEQRVFLYDTYEKYGSARQCLRKFRCKFRDERVPSRQTVHSLVNTLITTGLLIAKKQKHKCRVFTEEKLDDIGGRLEYIHTPRKSLKRLAQKAGVSKSSARTALLKLRPCKTTVIHVGLAAVRSS